MEIEISDADRTILRMLRSDCRIGREAIGKSALISAEAVSSRISCLEKSGVIRGYKAHINFPLIGYRYGLGLRLWIKKGMVGDPSQFRELLSMPEVYSADATSGIFDILVNLRTNDAASFFYCLKRFALHSRFSKFAISGAMFVHKEPEDFNPFSKEAFSPIKPSPEQIELDPVDMKLLFELRNDSLKSPATLASILNSSPSIIEGKINLLEKKGVIKKYFADIDYRKLGFQTKFITSISLEKKRIGEPDILSKIASMPQVNFLLSRNAGAKLDASVLANDFEDMKSKLRELGAIDGIRHLRTSVSYLELKCGCNYNPL